MSITPDGDFDVAGFLERGEAYLKRMERLQEDMAAVVGRARDEDGLVAAEFGAGGLTELELHPKAMRLSSGELAERVKEVVRAASADLQRRLGDLMEDALPIGTRRVPVAAHPVGGSDVALTTRPGRGPTTFPANILSGPSTVFGPTAHATTPDAVDALRLARRRMRAQ